ncbi:hypothetical protein AVEN_20008-1, partial [Araneus ventricosus]
MTALGSPDHGFEIRFYRRTTIQKDVGHVKPAIIAKPPQVG